MKYKFITIAFLSFCTYSAQAVFGRIIIELLEPVIKKPLTKQMDNVPANILTPNDMAVIQTLKEGTKPLLKNLSLEQNWWQYHKS